MLNPTSCGYTAASSKACLQMFPNAAVLTALSFECVRASSLFTTTYGRSIINEAFALVKDKSSGSLKVRQV